MKSRPTIIFLFALLTSWFAACNLLAAIQVSDLRCEYFSHPLGVDVAQPRLSWIEQSNVRGDSQTAYRVLVASSPALLGSNTGDLWDSGQVSTNVNASIPYAGLTLQTAQQVYWKVQVWDGSGTPSPWSTNASWTMGIMNSSDWQAQWITPSVAATDTASSLMRKGFNVSSNLSRALVYVGGLGQYEMTLNGCKVGRNLLTPGWSKYNRTCLYDTYDVTAMLQTGTNAIGLMLGNGMYNIPSSSRYAKFTGTFGPRKAIAQIVLQYTDGTSQTTGTDGTWHWNSGPITFNTIYGGEDYDARLEISGWNLAGFDDSSWSSVTVTTGPGGSLKGTTYGSPPVVAQQVFTPTNSWVIGTDSTVYDFGQNAAQMPAITVHGPAGSTVTLIPAELVNANHTLNQIVSPTYMTYTLKGAGSETFTPRFFYFGCRYLQLNLRDSSGGTTGTVPTLDNLAGTAVYSASDNTGSFLCSKPLFNSIRALILWAQCNNSMSLFTDCPTREKLGWLEQDYLNGPGLRYERNLNALFKMMENNLADSQLGNGLVPDIAPEYTVFGGGFRDSPEWGSAVIQIPWQQYEFAADTGLLAQYYAAMKGYVDYLSSKSSGYIVNYGLGDWFDLGPRGLGQAQLTPVALTATASYYSDAVELSQIATLLGNAADAATYRQLATNIAAAFNSQFYNAATGYYSTNSNTSDAMPLATGLVASTNVTIVVSNLVQTIRNLGNAWTAGDIGYRYLLRALADNGRSDVVFDMISRTNNPGYGYILAQGATSMTEGWDASNSQDHFMLGQATEWFYHDLAGIQTDSTGPGFQKIIIKPSVVGDVTWANASYYSIRGSISNYWMLNSNQMTMRVAVPVGSTATVYLPTLGTGSSNVVIQESGTVIWQNGVAGSSPGVSFQDFESSGLQTYSVWTAASGNYQFNWNVFPAPTGLAASTCGGQVALNWNPVFNATGYNVKRSLTSGGPYTIAGSAVTTTNYTDAAVINGTNYYYVVSAVGTNGESANSTEVSATPGTLLNYGFETPSVSSYQYGLTGGSWTFSASIGSRGSGISANNSAFTSGNPVAPQGVQVAFLQGAGVVSQAVSGFNPGTSYTMTFSAAQRNDIYTPQKGQTWNVTVNGAVIASYAPPESASNYVDYTASFLATNSTLTLAFVGSNNNGGDNTVFLDNVRLAPISTLAGTIIGTAGSWDNSGNTITNVFDGDLGTYFDGPDATGDWVGLDFGCGVSNVIRQLLYCPRSSFANRMTNGVFQAANTSNFSDAVTLFTISALPAQGAMTSQSIANTNAFRFVRYVGPANGSCNVAELQFLGLHVGELVSLVPPQLTWQISGRQIQISWPADHTGWHLQMQTNSLAVGLTANWITLPGSTGTNQFLAPLGNSSAFFRLIFP
jgi:hypothetical protein